jgi:uncharacterized membrane protein (UPF0127 family)
MNVKQLVTPWQRSIGAMFRKRLGETVLLFAYPHPAPRWFHTFFCPPLRIIALDDAGEILFDQVKQSGQIVRLPVSSLIIEADPDQEFPPEFPQGLVRNAPEVNAA